MRGAEPRRHRVHQVPAERDRPTRARRLLQRPADPGLALQVSRGRHQLAHRRSDDHHHHIVNNNNKHSCWRRRLRDSIRHGSVARLLAPAVRVPHRDQGRGHGRPGRCGRGTEQGRDPLPRQQERHVRRGLLSDGAGRLHHLGEVRRASHSRLAVRRADRRRGALQQAQSARARESVGLQPQGGRGRPEQPAGHDSLADRLRGAVHAQEALQRQPRHLVHAARGRRTRRQRTTRPQAHQELALSHPGRPGRDRRRRPRHSLRQGLDRSDRQRAQRVHRQHQRSWFVLNKCFAFFCLSLS